jgi:Mg2+/Co2+ transporter CorC
MDNNNIELSNEEIGMITSDFIKVSDQLKNTCKKIIEKKFSEFPVIIMSKDEVNLGTLLIDQNEIKSNKWKYFASYLEFLHSKKILKDIDIFKEKYKSHDEYCCLLTVINNNSKIIFIPYPED